MAPVQYTDPTVYNASSYNTTVTVFNTTMSDNTTTPENTPCSVTDPGQNERNLHPDPSAHWKNNHHWLPIGLLAGLSLLFLLWALHLLRRLRKARRELRELRGEEDDAETTELVSSGTGAGSSAAGPAGMSEKVSGAPVVMVTPAANGSGQEVVVTTSSSGGPGTTVDGPGSAMAGSNASGGQTLVVPAGAGDQSTAAGGSTASPSMGAGGAGGASTMNPTTHGSSSGMETQTADPRGTGATSTFVEQPQTVTETPGLVVREAPRV